MAAQGFFDPINTGNAAVNMVNTFALVQTGELPPSALERYMSDGLSDLEAQIAADLQTMSDYDQYMADAAEWRSNEYSHWDTEYFFSSHDGDIYDEAAQIFDLVAAIFSANPLLSNGYTLASEGASYLDDNQGPN